MKPATARALSERPQWFPSTPPTLRIPASRSKRESRCPNRFPCLRLSPRNCSRILRSCESAASPWYLLPKLNMHFWQTTDSTNPRMMRGQTLELTRLHPMKRLVLPFLLLAATPLLAQQPPEIRFQSVPNFLKLPPDLYLGEATGVAVNSKGHVFVFSRGNTTGPAYSAAAAQLLEFAPDGKFLREIGHNLYAWSFAHTVKVDKDDNIWAADKGSDMVIKFNPEGRVVLVFGRKQEASDEGTEPLKHVKPPLPPVDGAFRQVTDVAWDSMGNIYISDGYVNSRIAKIDKDGNWLKSWGEPGDQPGQFSTPHSIAVDAQNNIYVADRGNRRIQVFNSEGKFLRQFTIDVPAPADARPAVGNK